METGLAAAFAVALACGAGAATHDLVFYGSSPAAISAAVQAKRMGATAVVVSPETRIGGLTTGGLGQTDIGNKAAFGGIALEFYRAVAAHYGNPANWRWQKRGDYFPDGQCAGTKGADSMWTFEPSAALAILEGWEKRDGLEIVRGERLDRGPGGVTKKNGRIVSFRTLSGKVFAGRMFVDATYEGDLMAAAGVSYAVGREPNAQYGETLGGVEVRQAKFHQFSDGVDPHVRQGDPKSGYLPRVEPHDPSERDGDGDRRVQAYCFRMCLTDNPTNRIPFAKPAGYDEREYELLFREFARWDASAFVDERGAPRRPWRYLPWINSPMPNRKTDTNNRGGFSTDFIGGNWDYPEASYARREEIVAAHLAYQRGLMWTLANHPRVPEPVRKEVSRWGTCKDEFEDGFGDGWQRQLYVREARRMVGEYVMTEDNCTWKRVAPRPVAMAAYTMDSHHVRRHVTAEGFVRNEGDVEVSRTMRGPFPIDYGAIVPRRNECGNLLVPVCLSASHVAFGSIRMEPVFFALGQAAATAAALANEAGCTVQDLPFGTLAARLAADGQVAHAVKPPAPVVREAKMASWNGAPAIMVDGEPIPPMMMTVVHGEVDARKRAYYRRLGAAGFRVFFLMAETDWLAPPDPAKPGSGGVARTKRLMRAVLDEVPDAFLVIRLVVSPPPDWVNAHPEEQLKFSDGSRRRMCCSTSGWLDGMFSLCSDAWRARAERELDAYFDAISREKGFSRVIGAFLGSGGTEEWYYPQRLHQPDGAYGDFSEPFRREYERFLRAKYGTEENLRKAWNRADASFAKPLVPTPAEKEYQLGADEKIALGLVYREGPDAAKWPKFDRDARGPYNVGTFLNADAASHVADFYEAWHLGTARTIVRLARKLKAKYPNRLTGAFYGSLGCTDYHDGGTAAGTLEILDSGAVDFLAAPGVYNNREPGSAIAMREMQDSFRLRNMIFVNEDDVCTHCNTLVWGIRREHAEFRAGLRDFRDTEGVLKREFARVLCTDVQSWWFDIGGNWYDDDRILALFARQQEIGRFAYAHTRDKGNEVAILCDLDSTRLVSRFTSRHVLDFWRTTEAPRIGTGADWYFHDDVARPDMPDYKLYVMLNDYCLTAAQREAIWTKARRNGATILWMHAPGFVDPGATPRMSAANVAKTVGMEVKAYGGTIRPHFRVDPDAHPLVAGAHFSRRYGVIDRDVHDVESRVEREIPRYANPAFEITDPAATVLGRYLGDVKTAMAAKKVGNVTSVYCAAPVMQADLLRSVAKGAGCHVYSESGDVLYANANFVAIHAEGDGKRTIRFRRTCSPYDVYARRFDGRRVDMLEVVMRHGETRTWYVGEEAAGL